MNLFKPYLTHNRFLILAASLMVLLAFTFVESDTYKQYFTEDYKIKAPFLPDHIEFAGEKMPLTESDIKERMDREIMATVFWQSNTMMILKRSRKYFAIIEPILEEYGMPEDFKYLCVAESGLSNAVSPAGARGFWQLMEGTAKPLGLEINEFVDERYQLEKATRSACLYFKESYASLKNWTLTAASYNRGMNGLNRDIAFQGVNSFYDLYMNEETSRYIFRIMAYKLIFETPEVYGFYLKPEDYYKFPSTQSIAVDSTISDLSEFAKAHKSDYKTLKLLNPWLRDKSLPNKSKKKYFIELPKE